jgi:hypothetical protein
MKIPLLFAPIKYNVAEDRAISRTELVYLTTQTPNYTASFLFLTLRLVKNTRGFIK